VLIEASFRENLDVLRRYSDADLERVLRDCSLFDMVERRGGLNAKVERNGLSAGEEQLLCICRAFLKDSRIILIDEATANIDARNDALIQAIIAEKFRSRTVLTIAHRLSTLQHSDKIMVMERGALVEFGPPKELEEKRGAYYEMVQKYRQQQAEGTQ
jgi:ABC-type multidrug transport system fused ATPase/permease subunit